MDELIYNQHRIPKDQWRYGLRTSAATGCGWIATHNALRLMGYPSEPEELIQEYEHQLPLVHGNTGTSLFGVFRYFQKRNFPVDLVLGRKHFDQRVQDAHVAILFYRWRKKWKFGAHFVTVHYTDEGFVGYNTYTTSAGPDQYGQSLSGFLKRRKYFGAVLIIVDNPGGEKPRKVIYPTPEPPEEVSVPAEETVVSDIPAEECPEEKDTAVT